MVTSSAVVGSSAKQDRRVARQRNGQHDALAHAAGKVVRIQATPLLRPVDADKAHQLEHALFQSRAAQAGAHEHGQRPPSCAPTVMLGFSAVIGS